MSQIEREQASLNIVWRYHNPINDKILEHQQSQIAQRFLWEEFLKNGGYGSVSDNSDNHGSLLNRGYNNFQRKLEEITGIPQPTQRENESDSRAKRGRPHKIKKTWELLNLKTDSDDFCEDATFLFLITLHVLLVTTTEFIIDDDKALALVLDETEDTSNGYNESDGNAPPFDEDKLQPFSQQEVYRKLWECIAIEIYFREQQSTNDNEIRRRKNILRKKSHRYLWGRTANEIAKDVSKKLGADDSRGSMWFSAILVNLLISSLPTKWFVIKQVLQDGKSRKSTPSYIYATPALLEQLRALSIENLMVPERAPLIETPVDWGHHGIRQGGYYVNPLPFIKFSRKNEKIRQFLQEIDDPLMFADVFDATNTLQRTAWRVNTRVWDVVEEFYELVRAPLTDISAEGLTGVSASDTSAEAQTTPIATNARFRKRFHSLSGAQRDKWREWLRSNFYALNASQAKGPGARMATRTAKRSLFDGLRGPLYFAHQADSRGRMYPIGAVLSPIGEDLARALLEFDDPLPIGVQGIRPLAIYGSQQVDDGSILSFFNEPRSRYKPTLEERVEWIEAHTDKILSSARAPLLETWWRGDESFGGIKVKKPFTFLAFCFAWADYKAYGEKVTCSLPVHVDGTCNGLQHIAMLMRDAALAKATNVLPSDRPHDLYTEVSNIVKERMFEPPKKNMVSTDAQVVDTSNVISFLRQFPDLVDRGMGKSVVMIIPYGAGEEKYKQEIAKILINRIAPKRSRMKHGEVPMSCYALEILGFFNGHKEVPLERPDAEVRSWIRNKLASYLAAHFQEAVSDHFPVIGTFKKRLGKSIKPLTDSGIPVMWVSPSGMPVIQDVFKPHRFPGVEVCFPGFRKVFTHKELSEEISPKQQAQGILANFIHSMDAAHLVKTVNLARERGIHSISTVHDSYASHACHVDLLGKCIREAFCLLYPNDVDRLMAFEDWCSALIGAPSVHDADPFSPTEQVLLRLAEAWSKSDGKSQEQTSGPRKSPVTQSGVEDWAEQIPQSAYFFS